MRRAALLFALALAACQPSADRGLLLVRSLDMGLQELPAPALESLGLPYGLAVVRRGDLAGSAGLQVGDVVHGVNRTPIRSQEHFSRLLAEHAGGSIALLVRRGKRDFYVMVEPGRARPGAPPRDTLLST